MYSEVNSKKLYCSYICIVCGIILTSCSRSQTASTEQHPLDTLRIDVGSGEAATLDPALSEDAPHLVG